MAITASITLTSGANDLVTDALALATSSSLSKAGATTALSNTTGLARKTTTTTDQYTLLHADNFTSDKAHKLYVKNTSTVADQFFTIHVDDEKLGLMYAGDWALIPWAATDGVKQAVRLTIAADWATADTVTFDGVTVTGAAAASTAAWIELLAATKYPNWTAAELGGASDVAVIFTAKNSNNLENFQLGSAEVATGSIVATITGNGTAVVAQETEGVASANDIKITPGQAANTIEYMLFYE
tara:strand:+ start:269 stop:994 length:726 start_codon:yes stop_codon:yes gene_type:complete